MLAVLFGSTAFDSFRDSASGCGSSSGSSASTFLLDNVALLAFCVAGGPIFALGPAADRRRRRTRGASLPDQFAHSIVPIVVGYVFAHYLTYLVEYGQTTLIQASDPLSNGSDCSAPATGR